MEDSALSLDKIHLFLFNHFITYTTSILDYHLYYNSDYTTGGDWNCDGIGQRCSGLFAHTGTHDDPKDTGSRDFYHQPWNTTSSEYLVCCNGWSYAVDKSFATYSGIFSCDPCMTGGGLDSVGSLT